MLDIDVGEPPRPAGVEREAGSVSNIFFGKTESGHAQLEHEIVLAEPANSGCKSAEKGARMDAWEFLSHVHATSHAQALPSELIKFG